MNQRDLEAAKTWLKSHADGQISDGIRTSQKHAQTLMRYLKESIATKPTCKQCKGSGHLPRAPYQRQGEPCPNPIHNERADGV